ncbi:MAG: lipid IV(A) 3-deoxy-D-manno-octulosonic acid transferase [Methylococcales bacterium]|nr:lipid IV(A) 3-deoxy-D-manno-octulosonic acid transferase [Methylococcales bacterium]MDD5754222.1 lipid IV(A) 3-deoxy-D-manno-octulosonic acid transferase [Methylococcales bacterium]
MRRLYSLLFYCSIPLVISRLWWRSLKNPAYRQRVSERFGFYSQSYAQNVIWFHAVSVGESEALFPLIRLIQTRQPQLSILITTTTPTGSARVQAVLGDSVQHVYLPYDLPDVITRFFNTFKPRLAVIVETEIWVNLYQACAAKQIPLYLINARLSEKSVRGYQKIPSLVIPTLNAITKISTQTENDKARFVAIGANPDTVQNLGNIKFDITISTEILSQGGALKNQFFAQRFVFLAASTHDGEEVLLLDVYKQLKKQIPKLVLVIAPRHSERFMVVENLAKNVGLNVITRTSQQFCDNGTDVFVINTLGELKMFYATADMAFVGGSFVPVGGHNVLEPAAVGVPILFGHEMQNFAFISEKMLAAHAAIQCENVAQLETKIIELYEQPELRKTLISNAKNFVVQNQGATERIYKLLNLESLT